MSHYVVFAITKTDSFDELERLLAPYDESLEVDPHWEDDDLTFSVDTAAREGSITEERAAEIKADPQALIDFTRERYGDDDATYRVHEGKVQTQITYNPDSKWDWWVLGGRWSGILRSKDGTGVKGRPGTMGAEHTPDGFDQLRGDNVDWEAMAGEIRPEIRARYDRIWATGLKPEQLPPIPSIESGATREDFQAWWHSPEIERLSAAWKKPDNQDDPFFLLGVDPEGLIEPLRLERDEYVENETWALITPYAIVDHESWLAPGDMGWFGVSSDRLDEKRDYKRKAREILTGLGAEHYINVVDCHI